MYFLNAFPGPQSPTSEPVKPHDYADIGPSVSKTLTRPALVGEYEVKQKTIVHFTATYVLSYSP